MLTIQQVIRAVRDLQKRVDELEAAAKRPVEVAPPPVFQAPTTSVRRGRPPKVIDADVDSAPTTQLPSEEV
jgi:hypothetical protein